jgi:LPXTG-motif cell wall-anchored protein
MNMKGIAFWTSAVALSVLPAVAIAQTPAISSIARATPAPSADISILGLVMMGAAVGVVLLRKRKA